MILIYALCFILGEAITEGLLKRNSLVNWIFKWWLQWVIAIFLFGAWFIIAYHFDGYYVPTWKIIVGFIFVRFFIFDFAYNLANGQKWDYYGTTKLYDRIMAELDEYGLMLKVIAGIMGICFLLGWN